MKKLMKKVKPGVSAMEKDYWFPNRHNNNLDRMRSIAKIFDLDYDGKLIITSTPIGGNNWSGLTNNTRMIFKVPVGGVVNKPTIIKKASDFIKIFGKIGK